LLPVVAHIFAPRARKRFRIAAWGGSLYTPTSMARYDYILRGGTVLDGTGRGGRQADVAIADGRVAEITPAVAGDARREIDCTGLLICPGLIDLHTHVFDGVSVWGVPPDVAGVATGVTTVVDAGSAGSTTFPGFRRYFIEPARTRVLAYLHIVTIGIITGDQSGVCVSELSDPHYLNVDAAVETVSAHRDVLVGIKVRLTASYTEDETAEARALDATIEAGERAGVPVMVHHAMSRVSTDEVMAKLRPGDIYTHCFHPNGTGIVDADLRVLDSVRQARSRGVVFDIGHGGGAFGWDVARACTQQDFWPDVISTDLHSYNIRGPVYDLPTTLSKLLHLGMELPKVIAAATSRPAAVLGRSETLGRLEPGCRADVSILQAVEGEQKLNDVKWVEETAAVRLVPRWTVSDGLLCGAGYASGPPR
jgi:dihydroorotase